MTWMIVLHQTWLMLEEQEHFQVLPLRQFNDNAKHQAMQVYIWDFMLHTKYNKTPLRHSYLVKQLLRRPSAALYLFQVCGGSINHIIQYLPHRTPFQLKKKRKSFPLMTLRNIVWVTLFALISCINTYHRAVKLENHKGRQRTNNNLRWENTISLNFIYLKI